MDRLDLMRLALTNLGVDEQLDDPDATDSRAARAFRDVWDMTRDATLRAHLWNFAVDPAGRQLTADGAFTAATLGDHSHRFALPEDYLRLDLQRLRPENLRRDVRVSRRYIYANDAGPIHIAYVARVEAVGEWDELFCNAFAWRLAAATTKRITGGAPAAAGLMQEFRAAVLEAKSIDGRENPPEEIEDTDWVASRYDGSPGQRFY